MLKFSANFHIIASQTEIVNSLKLSFNNKIFWPVTCFFKNLTENYGHAAGHLAQSEYILSVNARETVLMTAKPMLLLLLVVVIPT